MALVINTNVASLNAQRNVDRSQGDLNTALQRLSTGLRINSAKDDAAGLAIATRFTTQINGLNQAVRNANDGISLAQTGESALDEITNNLQRIRELAVQSANATNSSSDRAALDEEVEQRLAEISRIANQTSFNGQKVLNGTFGTAQFQVGANVGETISVNLNQGVRSDQIGQIASQTGDGQVANRDLSGALGDGDLTIALGTADAVSVGASVDGSLTGGTAGGQDASSVYAKATAINSAGIQGLTATATTEVTLGFTATSATDSYSLAINGVDIFSGTTSAVTAQDAVDAINNNSGDTGVTAAVSGSNIVLTADDGSNIELDQTNAVTGNGFTGTVVQYDGTAADFTGTSATENIFAGDLTLSASEKITLTGAQATTIESLGLADSGTSLTIALDTTTLSTVGVDTVSNAEDTIQRVDSALQTVSNLRSEFGAIQNRFESTITNLQTISENLSASRSRIQDADFAAETAKLTKAQILQQAGISILAQANAAPQSVLALLQ